MDLNSLFLTVGRLIKLMALNHVCRLLTCDGHHLPVRPLVGGAAGVPRVGQLRGGVLGLRHVAAVTRLLADTRLKCSQSYSDSRCSDRRLN